MIQTSAIIFLRWLLLNCLWRCNQFRRYQHAGLSLRTGCPSQRFLSVNRDRLVAFDGSEIVGAESVYQGQLVVTWRLDYRLKLYLLVLDVPGEFLVDLQLVRGLRLFCC